MRYLLLCCVLLHSTIARGVYVTTPEEHGAKGDGKTNDWIAILAAVSSCEGYTRCTVSFNKNVSLNYILKTAHTYTRTFEKRQHAAIQLDEESVSVPILLTLERE